MSHVDLEWLCEQAQERRTHVRPSKRDNRRRNLLASQLAKRFGPRETNGPCASCDSPDCFDLGCANFWDYVLSMNKEAFKKMLKVHLIYRGRW